MNHFDRMSELIEPNSRALKESIRNNVGHVMERVKNAARRAGRRTEEVTLVAVTKTYGPEVINTALTAGLHHIGENRVQEFLEKAPHVKGDVRWHFIGHLQRNKVKKIIGSFALIHSVDSSRLAREISERSMSAGIVQDVLLQVHTAREETKYGISPEALHDFVKDVASLGGIAVRGLMTVGSLVSDPECVRKEFLLLRQLKDDISEAGIEGVTMKELSMGMTGDFEVAIEEGATLIRVGTAIFGKRQPM
jgi:hypothetical protein